MGCQSSAGAASPNHREEDDEDGDFGDEKRSPSDSETKELSETRELDADPGTESDPGTSSSSSSRVPPASARRRPRPLRVQPSFASSPSHPNSSQSSPLNEPLGDGEDAVDFDEDSADAPLRRRVIFAWACVLLAVCLLPIYRFMHSEQSASARTDIPHRLLDLLTPSILLTMLGLLVALPVVLRLLNKRSSAQHRGSGSGSGVASPRNRASSPRSL